MADKKILSIQDGLSENLPDIKTAKAGRFLITTDSGEMYYEPEDGKRVKINKIDQTYSPTSENAQSGKAVAEAVGEVKSDLTHKYMKLPSDDSYGEAGQYPRSTGKGIEWADMGLPTDEQTETAVTNWLNSHPEATTTVQDRSISEEKFNESLGYYRKANFYDTVADMVSDKNLKIGRVAITLGYYSKGDGGGGIYSIISSTNNTYDYIPCVNGVAELQIENNTLNFLQLGAKKDLSADCADIMIYAQASNRWFNIYMPSGSYKFTKPINMYTSAEGKGLPNHNLYGDRMNINWDNYKKATKLYYYPTEENTSFLNVRGWGLTVHDLFLCNKVFGLSTSGMKFVVTRGQADRISIVDFDYDSLILDSPYSILNYIECGATNDLISYVKEDIENRRAHALCFMSDKTTSCGNVVTNLSLGSPTYNIHEYGLLMGGLNNKFIAPFIPSPALYPIYVKGVCRACSIENLYAERGTNEAITYLTFEKGSGGNVVTPAYFSGNFSYEDNGYFNKINTVFTLLNEIGPIIPFEKLSDNALEATFSVVDGVVKLDSNTTTNFYNMALSAGCTDIDEDGFIVGDCTQARIAFSGRIKANSELMKKLNHKGVYIIAGAYIKADSTYKSSQQSSMLYGATAGTAKPMSNQFGSYFKGSDSEYIIGKVPNDLNDETMWIWFSCLDTKSMATTENAIIKFKPFLYLYYMGNAPFCFE